MAVAAHVSRVAKDYSPFGYSVMETIIAQGKSSVGATPLDTNFYAVMIDDADVYIESIELIGIDAIDVDGTNFVTTEVWSWGSAKASPVKHASATTDSGESDVVALVADVWRSLTVSKPVVAKGRYVVFRIEKSQNHSDVNSKRIQCAIRYRRKA